MTHPWKGPRYQSWASNTVLSGLALVVILITTVIIDMTNGADSPPTYLTGLLGVASGAFFGAVGVDKGKREKELEQGLQTVKNRTEDNNETALRAELKADILAEIAHMEHPNLTRQIPPPLMPRRLRDHIENEERKNGIQDTPDSVDDDEEQEEEGGSL